jgi:hypothetical protein
MASSCLSMRCRRILGTGWRRQDDGLVSGLFAAGLICGQVKKTYRRQRLVRVTPIMRCSPRAALQAARTELGLSGRLNTAFVERVKKDAAAERRGSGASQLVNTAGGATLAGAAGMVARLVALRAAASVATSCTGTVDCARWAAAAAAVPPADTRNGHWPDAPALDSAGSSDTRFAVGATRHGLSAAACRTRRLMGAQTVCDRPHGRQWR